MKIVFFWGCSYCGPQEPQEVDKIITCWEEDGQCVKCKSWCGPFLVVGPEKEVMEEYRKEQEKHAV